jgi:hypothetical protein
VNDEKYFDAHEMEALHKMFRRELCVAPGLVRHVVEGDRLAH